MTNQAINNIPNHLELLGFEYYDAKSIADASRDSKYKAVIAGTSFILGNLLLSVNNSSSMNLNSKDHQQSDNQDYGTKVYEVTTNFIIPAFDKLWTDRPSLAKAYHDASLYFANETIHTIGEYVYGTGESANSL